MKADVEHYVIQVVSRALDLLEQFQISDAELGITELSRRMNLHKNNVFRLVATLKEKNYIEMNSSTGKYRLGIKTRTLGQVATRRISFADHVHPFLNDLTQQCHEACYFSVVRDGHAYHLDGVESDCLVRVFQQVGNRRPLYCTAAGKVLLAFMESRKRSEMVSGVELRKHTSRTITDLVLLENELEKVTQRGYAIDDQEHEVGVMEIAAPVFDSNGAIIGALSILGPEMRLAGARLNDELIPFLCYEALRISNALGHYGVKETVSDISLHAVKPQRKRNQNYNQSLQQKTSQKMRLAHVSFASPAGMAKALMKINNP